MAKAKFRFLQYAGPDIGYTHELFVWSDRGDLIARIPVTARKGLDDIEDIAKLVRLGAFR